MKSLLLQQLARLILPLAVFLGLALLLKGHNEPGGGFVSGLSFAVAGILGFTAYGAKRFHASIPLEPDRVALLGGLIVLASILLPLPFGEAGLTQLHAEIGWDPVVWKLHSTLLFEVGVVMIVAGSLCAAALWLWELPQRGER